MIKPSAIDHINLSVLDVGRSVDFYGRVFGFEVVEDRADAETDPWAIVAVPGAAALALHQSSPAGPAGDGGLSIDHFGLVIEDVEAALAHLESEGVEVRFQERPGGPVIDWGKSNSIYIADPDGHVIELTTKFAGGLA